MGRIGVCSWSLQPESALDLIEKTCATGVGAVQLALDPLRTGGWPVDAAAAVREAGIDVLSGMMETGDEDYSTLDTIRETGGIGPDATWEKNLALADADARIAAALGLELVTFHAGFIPHEGERRGVLIDRIRRIGDAFASHGVRAGLETGQETADTLVGVLEELDHPGVGVNFDPANMILYGMGEPVSALRRLAPWVFQIHVKDALATDVAGTWGREVAVGTGAVDWTAFFDVVREKELDVDLVIEREAGGERIADVRTAYELVCEKTGRSG